MPAKYRPKGKDRRESSAKSGSFKRQRASNSDGEEATGGAEWRPKVSKKALRKDRRDAEDPLETAPGKRIREVYPEMPGQRRHKRRGMIWKGLRPLSEPTSSKVIREASVLTCVALAEDDSELWVGDHRGAFYRFDVNTGKIDTIAPLPKEQGGSPILSIACQQHNNFVLTGHQSGTIRVWDTRISKAVGQLREHRGAVNALCCMPGAEDLVASASSDRSVKIWRVPEELCIQSLYGHQAKVTSLDCLEQNFLLSGAEDYCARYWKYEEEKTAAYNEQMGFIDGVAQLNSRIFVAATQTGRLIGFATNQKKELSSKPHVHGFCAPPAPCLPGDHCSELERIIRGTDAEFIEAQRAVPPTPNGIFSIAAQKPSSNFATGSLDGVIRYWRLRDTRIQPQGTCQAVGAVNGLVFGNRVSRLFAITAPRCRLGGFFTVKGARNRVLICATQDQDETPEKEEEQDGEEEDEEEEEDL